MEKTLNVLNQLEKEGLIERYAIGGATASLFYMEPFLTYDVDVFVFLPKSKGKLILLTPLYHYLKNQGYREDREHVLIEGIPVQFIPAYDELVEEAVREAREVKYKEIKTRVVPLEHLAAIMLKTGRAKDKTKLKMLMEQTKWDEKKFKSVITRHGLAEKWKQFKSQAHDR